MQKMNDNSQNESIDSIESLEDSLLVNPSTPIYLADEVEATISKSAVDAAIDKLDKSDNSKKNIRSTLNRLMKLGFIDENRFEAQFAADEFHQLQIKVKDHVRAGNGQSNWNSHLNSIKHAVLSLVSGINIENMTFKEALHAICDFHHPDAKTNHQKATFLAQKTKISCKTVWQWVIGSRVPRSSGSIDFVQHLDTRFNFGGKLLAKVRGKPATVASKLKTRPCYNFEMPQSLQAELETYSLWKIRGIEPTKNSLFKKLSRKEQRRYVQKRSKWTEDANGECRSQKTTADHIKFFVNYLVKIHSVKSGSVTLVDLFDYDRLKGLHNFVIQQGYGHVSASAFLAWLGSECHKNSYAALTLEPPAKFGSLSDWVEELEEIKGLVKDTRANLEEDKEVLEGDRNVSWIIEQEEPREVVNEISAELKRLADIKLAVLKDNLIPEKTYTTLRYSMSFDFLTEIPVRKKNLIEAEWLGVLNKTQVSHKIRQEKNLCGIYQLSDTGDYWYFCAKPLLKNRMSRTVTDIHYRLSNLNDQLKDYLDIRARFLETKGKSCQRFLLNENGNKLIGSDMLFQAETLKAIQHLYPETKQYIEKGINPHGMRHLMATLFLKYNPEQYGALATLLMDDLSTVLSTYAKRDDTGNFEKIREYNYNAKRRGGDL